MIHTPRGKFDREGPGGKRAFTPGELNLELQREVSERLLLSALRDRDIAVAAEASRRDAALLASESLRLSESLDESETLTAMAKMSLPSFGAWCIVDTLGADDVMHRLAIIHPDPAKQALLDELKGRWVPLVGDAFGLPAALRSPSPTMIADNVDATLAGSSQDPEIHRALRELGVSGLLTVPLVVRGRVVGAVTYVAARNARPFSFADIELAQDLANRSALALDRARLYGEAVSLRALAEAGNQAKSDFLGMMSHDLRTPLNAIGGYVDIMEMGIHGPITDEQRVDLGRIRTSQRYLTGLINDLLNLTKMGAGKLVFDSRDVAAREVIQASMALVESLITERGLIVDAASCDESVVFCGDRERVVQILVNLISNAVKFTPQGGRLRVECHVADTTVFVDVTDTGIGIPADKIGTIFDAFTQVNGRTTGPDAGVGLGLAISRNFALGMKGDLTVESTPGVGSRFRLSLPRAVSSMAQPTG